MAVFAKVRSTQIGTGCRVHEQVERLVNLDRAAPRSRHPQRPLPASICVPGRGFIMIVGIGIEVYIPFIQALRLSAGAPVPPVAAPPWRIDWCPGRLSCWQEFSTSADFAVWWDPYPYRAKMVSGEGAKIAVIARVRGIGPDKSSEERPLPRKRGTAKCAAFVVTDITWRSTMAPLVTGIKSWGAA